MLYRNADVVVLKCVYVRYPIMSPVNNNGFNWDPSSLQLDQIAHSQRGTRRGRRILPITKRFIAGPIPVSWICQAGQLGVKALLVGLALWHIRGLRKMNTFIVSNLMLEAWGIQPDAKSRALRKLERAGLIRIDRQGKRSPKVTILISEVIEQPHPPTSDLKLPGCASP